MLTKRKMMIPIFNFALTVIIFDEWSDLQGVLSKEDLKEESKGITIFNNKGGALVAVNVKQSSTLAHEAFHVKNAVWRHIGYEPQVDNDEVDAYLLTYIYEKMVEVYYKHTGDIMY